MDSIARNPGSPERCPSALLPASSHPSGRGRHYPLNCSGHTNNGEALYTLALTPELCGKLEYRIRIFPTHPSLIHKFETGLMVWL